MKEKFLFLLLVVLASIKVGANEPLGKISELYNGDGQAIWRDQFYIPEDEVEKAFIDYEKSKSRTERIEPAFKVFRGVLSRSQKLNSFLDQLTPQQKVELKGVEKTLTWAKGLLLEKQKKLTTFNIHYITKSNKFSIFREMNQFFFFHPLYQCSQDDFDKLLGAYHSEFIFSHFETITTLIYDYEFISFFDYGTRFIETLKSGKENIKSVDLIDLESIVRSAFILPFIGNQRAINKRIFSNESKLKELSKHPKEFVYDILKKHPNCWLAFPVSKFYEKIRIEATKYFGGKMLALIQRYVDEKKALPKDDIKLWAELYEFYLKKFYKNTDKDPAGQFEKLTRDGWGSRYQVIRGENKFWLLSHSRATQEIRLGPGYVK